MERGPDAPSVLPSLRKLKLSLVCPYLAEAKCLMSSTLTSLDLTLEGSPLSQFIDNNMQQFLRDIFEKTPHLTHFALQHASFPRIYEPPIPLYNRENCITEEVTEHRKACDALSRYPWSVCCGNWSTSRCVPQTLG